MNITNNTGYTNQTTGAAQVNELQQQWYPSLDKMINIIHKGFESNDGVDYTARQVYDFLLAHPKFHAQFGSTLATEKDARHFVAAQFDQIRASRSSGMECLKLNSHAITETAKDCAAGWTEACTSMTGWVPYCFGKAE